MTNDTKDLQRAIDHESAALSDNLAMLGDMARDLTDWRVQVRRHPLPAVGLALGAGALLALLAGRGRATRAVSRGTHAAPTHRLADSFTEGPAHPAVDRVINALVGVAMTRAIELVGEMVPGFGHHLRTDADLEGPPAEPPLATNGRA